MRSRLCWACATLVSRLLRWKTRSRYTKLRGSCLKIQAAARIQIASNRIKNRVRASRIRRAEEAVQAVEVCWVEDSVWVATFTAVLGFRALRPALSIGDVPWQSTVN